VNPIIVSIPCRGRSQYLHALLAKLSATKSERSTIVVVSNGPQRCADPGFPGIYVVHIADVPTIAVAVNFGWYALGTTGCILAKIDNDIDPPDAWENDIVESSKVVSFGGFLNRRETPTALLSIGGRVMRRAHVSDTWGMPFIYGGFSWLGPELARRLQYHDERFIRSSDGDLGERASRIAGVTAAYSADQMYHHRLASYAFSTEPATMVRAMYEATDRLIRVLPPRDIAQRTIWEDCLTRAEAAQLVRSRGTLSAAVVEQARALLRGKLEAAYAPLGCQPLVEQLFATPSLDRSVV
jgi:hypothetical protein